MKVSVIVPVYNGYEYVIRCVESVLHQLNQDMELIVVDDASTDGTFALLTREYQKDGRVILVRSTVNGGPAVARNIGIKLPRGAYIGFCDADDEWVESKLQKQLRRCCYTKAQQRFILPDTGFASTGYKMGT